MVEQRLQKVLAAAGVDSRRNCEQLILDGAVCVNHKVVDKLPAFVDPDSDLITVNGRKIKTAQKKVYYLLNKPKGVICSNFDPQGRKKAIDLIDTEQRIFCIGRLDIDSTGLIILSNDNELANRLTHPKYGISKTYLAVVEGKAEGEKIEKLKKGIWLAEGKTEPAMVKIVQRGHQQSSLEITIGQGLNRQIRRMLAKVDLEVAKLQRIKIGKITLRGVKAGNYRELSEEEVRYLQKMTAEINERPVVQKRGNQGEKKVFSHVEKREYRKPTAQSPAKKGKNRGYSNKNQYSQRAGGYRAEKKGESRGVSQGDRFKKRESRPFGDTNIKTKRYEPEDGKSPRLPKKTKRNERK